MSDGDGTPERRSGGRDRERDPEERRATRTPGPTREGDSLADVVEMLLDKGIVINADIAVSVGETELLGVHIRAAIASFETAAEYGLQFPDGTDMRRVEAASGRTEMHSKGGSPLAIGSPGTPAGGPSPKNPVEDDEREDESEEDEGEGDDGESGATDSGTDADGGPAGEARDDAGPAGGDSGTGEAVENAGGAEDDSDGDGNGDGGGDGAGASTDEEGEREREGPSSEVGDDES
ncbi:gas vesicle protein [Halobacteriales archaeon QS_5_70_15]|nr:MAG: gas vesicle protein [Halobacteriales archaeon QS_5_70_15]